MGNVLNIAHRGFHKASPGNTLEAFDAALLIGVDGIEFDVQETADNGFIIFHDDRLQGVDIRKLSLNEVKNVKLQNKFEIPTLEQTLDLCRNQVVLFVELKKVWSLDKLLTLLKAKVAPDYIIVMSFNKDLVLGFKRLAPYIRTGIITALPFKDPIKVAKSAQCSTIVVRFLFATSRLVNRARASNLSVFVWGCPDMKAANKALRLDVDGIISDFPDLVKEELGE